MNREKAAIRQTRYLQAEARRQMGAGEYDLAESYLNDPDAWTREGDADTPVYPGTTDEAERVTRRQTVAGR